MSRRIPAKQCKDCTKLNSISNVECRNCGGTRFIVCMASVPDTER